ncbi:MAG: Signal peptidase I T [bacterium ADurb.Bin212]|nr:MAG: Signal peptidase I T [bacterium ADurb.Bin212]
MNQLIEKIIYGGGLVFDLSKWIIFVLICLVLVNSFWYSIFIVDGLSMEPSLHDGEVVMMDKSFVRQNKKPQRGDAVVVKYPGDPDQKRYVKRVIGLPGETVAIKNNKVSVNKKVIRESYIPLNAGTFPDGVWLLDDEEYFLMGDNRENSNDSRYFGPVAQRFFIGRATNVILPSLRSLNIPQYDLNLASK